MAHHVVRLAHELVAGKAADAHEGFVAVGDAALQVGHGDERLLGRQQHLAVLDRKVHAHVLALLVGRARSRIQPQAAATRRGQTAARLRASAGAPCGPDPSLIGAAGAGVKGAPWRRRENLAARGPPRLPQPLTPSRRAGSRR